MLRHDQCLGRGIVQTPLAYFAICYGFVLSGDGASLKELLVVQVPNDFSVDDVGIERSHDESRLTSDGAGAGI